MDHRVFAVLVLRLVGLWLVISSIPAIPKIFVPYVDPYFRETLKQIDFLPFLLFNLAAVGISMLLGLLLLFFPGTISTGILRIEDARLAPESTVLPLLQVAFSAIGLWLAIDSVLDAVNLVAKLPLYYRMQQVPSSLQPGFTASDFAEFVTSAVQLVIGVFLLFASKRTARIVTRRQAG